MVRGRLLSGLSLIPRSSSLVSSSAILLASPSSSRGDDEGCLRFIIWRYIVYATCNQANQVQKALHTTTGLAIELVMWAFCCAGSCCAHNNFQRRRKCEFHISCVCANPRNL